MNSLQDTNYNRILNSFAVGTVLLLQQADASMVESITNKATHDQFVNYNSSKQSTHGDSFIQNDVEMLKILEISKINDKIETLYGTSIVEHWIPADGILEKTCLFIRVDNQEQLMTELDLELDLYLKLESEISESNFFNMIALI
ncbi:MAG: hypothetical protein L3J19_05685 [Sulfurimonas sp.]|nr:hypothetical protein [Sulfurimonas sp.]